MAENLPDTEAEFLNGFFGGSEKPTAGATFEQQSVLPTSASEIARMPPSGLDQFQKVSEEQRQKTLGKEEGVPLQEGLDPWTHLMATARRTKEDQIRYLAGKFGANNVRLNELDEPVVRVTDPQSKKPKDIVVNPHTMNLNDLVTLGSYVPEVAGSILALRMGPGAARAIGGSGAALGKMGQALLGAVGAETAGAGKDVLTRAYDRPENMDLGEIAESRLKAVPVDAAVSRGVDLGLAKPAQVVFDMLTGKGLPNPFASRMAANPELAEEGKAGARRLAGKFRQDPVEFSAGESTGWPALQMAEAYSEAQPAGTTPMVRAAKRQDDQILKLQEAMLDPASLPSDEEIGRRGVAALERSVQPAQKGVEQARQQGSQSILRRILQTFKAKDIPVKGVYKAEAGDAIQTGALKRRDEFFDVNNVNYDRLFSHPLAKANVIDGDLVAKPIRNLMQQFPKVEETTMVTSPIKGPTGKPIVTPVTQERVLEKQIKPGLLSRLEELASLEGGKVSLQTLKQIRTDIDDAIKVGEAVPGVKEGFLKAARGAVSDAIEQGIDKTGDPMLKQLFNNANNYYKNNVQKFTEKNIATLFKDASQSSSIGGSQFVENLVRSPDKYAALKGFLGSNSPEIEALHKTVSDTLLHDSLADGVSKTVDGAELVKRLIDLRKTNPDLYNSAFGSRANDLIRNAKALGGAQGKLDLEEVSKVLDPKSPDAMALFKIQAHEENLNRAFQNETIRKYLGGDKNSSVNPEDLIRFLPKTKLSDVRGVVSRIGAEDPAALEQMQRKTLQAILQDASRSPTPEDVLRQLQGKPGDIVSGISIKQALGRGDQLEKYKALLGPELFDVLSDYTKIELVREKKRILAAGTGILTKGQAIGSFYRALQPGIASHASVGKEVASVAWNKAVAIALSNPTLRKWLTSPHTLSDMPKVTQSIVASEPFIKAAIEEFPGDLPRAYQFLSIVKQMAGLGKQRQPDSSATEQSGKPLPPTEAEFLKDFQQ